MTNEEILKSATALLNESCVNVPKDYRDRAVYILGQFYSGHESLDKRYRKAHGLPVNEASAPTVAELEAEFTFVPALAPSAIYYLAAMLVMDENEDLGDKIFALHADALSTVKASLPFTKEKIKNVY